jgi:hypothetical protein
MFVEILVYDYSGSMITHALVYSPKKSGFGFEFLHRLVEFGFEQFGGGFFGLGDVSGHSCRTARPSYIFMTVPPSHSSSSF